jgi:hypothetical protein
VADKLRARAKVVSKVRSSCHPDVWDACSNQFRLVLGLRHGQPLGWVLVKVFESGKDSKE